MGMIVLELERGCAFSSSHCTSLRAREPMHHCHNKALRAQVDLIPRGNCSLVCAVVVSTRLVAPILRFPAPRLRSLPLRPPGTAPFPPPPNTQSTRRQWRLGQRVPTHQPGPGPGALLLPVTGRCVRYHDN